jgi:hypothetical protein
MTLNQLTRLICRGVKLEEIIFVIRSKYEKKLKEKLGEGYSILTKNKTLSRSLVVIG